MRILASLSRVVAVVSCVWFMAARAVVCLADADPDLLQQARGILSNRCFACHGPDEAERQSGLRLDDAQGLFTPADSGLPAVVPGKPQQSELIRRIASEDEFERMPPPEFGKPLTESEIEVLTQWIAAGAELPTHWAYVAPKRPPLPRPRLDQELDGVDRAAWLASPIDRFVLDQMLRHGLRPSPPASRSDWLRRVTLDLTGLPPTEEQLDAFEHDSRPDAYQRVVDQLLASPAYGEHWGAKWLDLARYADSAGYADDPPRTIWAYRDWVIDAFNKNMPIDQFTIEQLAGDLLPDPTPDQIIATAFHRNTMTNNEGGTNDEEFRNVAIVDRVNTTMQVWMGTTMGCAQCHSHKYDPFSQVEYFQLFAVFNQTADADRRNEEPIVPVYSLSQRLEREGWLRRLAECEHRLQHPAPEVYDEFHRWSRRLGPPAFETLGTAHLEPLDESGEGPQAGPVRWSVQALNEEERTLSLSVPLELWRDRTCTALRLCMQRPSGPRSDHRSEAQANQVFLEEIEARVESDDSAGHPAARYVRVELPGKDKILSLAEVEVWSGNENVALRGSASQSSVDYDGKPARAIDGNSSGEYEEGSVTHTARSDNPWWEVDLQAAHVIDRIVVWNRTDGNVMRRLDGARIMVLDESRTVVFEQRLERAPDSHVAVQVKPMQRIAFGGVEASVSGSEAQRVIDDDLASALQLPAAGDEATQIDLALAQPSKAEAGSVLKIDLRLRCSVKELGGWRIAIAASDSNNANVWIGMDPAMRTQVQTFAQRSSAEQQRLVAWFAAHYSETTGGVRREIERLKRALQEQKPETTVPVMRRRDTPRETYVQIRGNYQVLGERVEPGTPAALHPIECRSDQVDRLDVARWLVDRDNPLTARVWVNRLWESLFGRGIVQTSEEFGAQGTPPTHPRLLDYLAIELMDSGWDQKWLLRQLVLSQVYRQSSQVTLKDLQRDADNVWLARGPRVRLTAEMVRDQALAAAGLLSRRMYGPPVRPPQPQLGLKAAFGSATDWQPSQGADRYRRAIYTYWRRSNPYPSMATFDAPSREVCTLRREATNTPLQALVTLNDPCFVEAAQGLARLVSCHREVATDAERLSVAFRRCTGRVPTMAESDVLQHLLDTLRETYRGQHAQAVRLASDPIGPLPEGADAVELAAWTGVCNVLLNLDEVLMKR